MPNYDLSPYVDVRQEGKLLTITLNRPERLNAIGDGMHEALEEIFGMISADDSVGAVLLTGAGSGFCAGGDVKSMAAVAQAGGARPAVRSPILGPKRLFLNLLECEQPIIAAVNGPAMGLGATLALFCDVVIMAEEAYIADTHVSVGLAAGDGGAIIWPLLMPVNRAKYYLMTGERLTGQQAQQMGLINETVPLAELLPRARALAERFANGPTWAIRCTKTSVNKVLRERLNLIIDSSMALEMWTFGTEDHREAATAFVEKRAPQFKGR